MASLHPHVVHVKDAIQVVRTKDRTYDRDRAPKGRRADGEDVVPASVRVSPDGDSFKVEQLPEVRTPFWLVDRERRHYTGPNDCPDCARGLSSRRGHAMVCPLVLAEDKHALANLRVTAEPVDEAKFKECHDGCVVACGLTDG